MNPRIIGLTVFIRAQPFSLKIDNLAVAEFCIFQLFNLILYVNVIRH